MLITQSLTIKRGAYFLESEKLETPVVTISGDNIVVDFNGAILNGTADPMQPDLFKGMGIFIENGKNIQIINAVIKGFKIGLLAENVDSLHIQTSNFSHNYRQRLKSTPDMEDLGDWLSHHDNDKDEWLRYGAGMYLKNCDQALVKDVTANEGQNGLLLVNCNNGLFYNNNMQFNSGLGIGLYHSSENRILHNKLDWCIRGYSHGIYNRGQDAAGILVYKMSNKNVVAYNSATHGGDGFFLWSGNTFIEKGVGGCNDNLVYGNDFSHASNNGVEITFSKNKIINNKINDCHYALWGGYSYESIIAGNRMHGNTHGVAFEHGHLNEIYGNHLEDTDIGIQLWERPVQPKEWIFTKNSDISSRNYLIQNNVFTKVKEPLKIEDSKDVLIEKNYFANFQRLLKSSPTNKALQFINNSIYQSDLLGDAYDFRNDNKILSGGPVPPINNKDVIEKYKVDPLSDGYKTDLPEHTLRGRQYMLLTKWGPYNFQYPSIWLRRVEGDQYTFALFGPQGNWKIVGGSGFTSFSRKTGAMPATVVATKGGADKPNLKVELEFIGTAFTDQLGHAFEKGRVYPFEFLLE